MGKTRRAYWEYATELDVLNIDHQNDPVDGTSVEETLRYFKIFNL